MIIKEEQAKKIAELLKLFYEKKNLNDRYTAKVPELPDFLKCLDTEINAQKTSYEKNIVLKEKLHNKIKEKLSVNDKENIKDIVLWIIRDWGGICRVNKNSENKNGTISLLPEFPKLGPGASAVSFSGGITEVLITPRWWTL